MTGERRVAVVGMACRFPGGAQDPESLWSMLAEGRDGWREVPEDRWDWKSFYHKSPDAKEATNFSHAYFLNEDLSAFDARFFGIPGAEAAGIDPQQRLLLEVTYEAIENAGIPMENLRGSNTSVHMAMFAKDYDRMGYRDGSQMHKTHIIGSGDAILANRISYQLDLKGTSNTLDTGCSGGLVAVHQACQALRTGECELALAGASQLLLTPDQSINMSQLTNKDGRCYAFDDRGAGYARGEGLGVLVLKRLDHAIADGDRIHAIVVDTGSNHDGKTSGIFLPNSDAQEVLARSVYSKAGLDPRETLFVECHGTGTVAGDSAEVASISKVFAREAGRTSTLPVGSIKSNIGHLEAASGIASMIKAIMVLKKNQIPPQLNFINPKPSLRLNERGIEIPLELTPLTPPGYSGPRRVSVNSFGYGGTNAHAILEAYPSSPQVNGLTNGFSHKDDVQDNLVVLSAQSEGSLKRLLANLRRWVASEEGQKTSLSDLALTLNKSRSKLLWRCSTLASDMKELEAVLADDVLRLVKSTRDVALAFVFTGQGAQWFGMGRELLRSSSQFRDSISMCNQVMESLGCDWKLAEELSRDKEASRLAQSRFAQPCTTAIQIALVDLLFTWGICPHAVWGHSSGEIAAAYAAGALTREAAMRVAYMRGIFSSEAKVLNTRSGAMLAVGEGEELISRRMERLNCSNGRVRVACVNSPESTTISGDTEAILELQALLEADSVFHRRLQVDSAYHSHHMDVVAQSYLTSLDNMPHGIPTKGVAFFSSVTGSRKETDFGPSYWVSNLVSQVKFSAATEVAAEYLSTLGSSANTIVEVGPHSALSGPLRQSLSKVKSRSSASFKYNYYPCLVRDQNAVSTTLTLGGKLFELGSPVNLDAVMKSTSAYQKDHHKPQVVDTLPSYPWDHSVSYWHESRLSKGYRQRPFPYHDLLGLFDVNSSPYEPRWRYHVSLEALPWLRDHVVEGFVIFPGVGYITMVIEAMKQLFQIRKTAGTVKNISFRDVTFARPVVVPSDDAKGSREVELQLIITPSRQHIGSSWEYFNVLSYDSQNDSWVDNCTGLVSWESSPDKAKAEKDETVYLKEDGLGHLTKTAADEWLREIRSKCSVPVHAADIYNDLASSGNQYGLSFQGLKEIHVSKNLGFAKIVVDDIAQQMPGNCMQVHTIHPTAFDSMVQLEAVIFRRECTAAPMMPVMLGEVSVAVDMNATPGTEFFVALQLVPESRREATADFCAYQRLEDGTFRPVVTASKIRPQTIGDANLDSAPRKTTYRIEWKPDVGYVTQDSFMDHVSLRNLFDVDYGRVSEEPAEVQLDLNNAVATYFVCKTVKRLRETNITSACSPHLSKLLDWMLKWNESEAAQYLSTFNSQREEELINRARSSNIVGLTLTRLGPRYFDILTGTADALELLIQDDLLGRLYSENTLFNSHYAQMAEYMAYLVHKSPSMNIIEIGAGTGGATMPLLKRLERDGRLLLDSYTYTDISSGFFERARTKFNTWSDQITFKTLDISRDPLAQGYTPHSFDLVVASMVLHATPMMDATMSNVHKLLKPGGRLVLLELTAFAAMQNGIFGTLEGWWMSEDGREDGPILTVTEWDAVLKRHGFQGVDLAIPAYKGRGSDVSALIIAQASLEIPENKNKQIAAIQLGNTDESQVFIGESLCVSLNSKGINCSKEAWGTTSAPGTDKLTIVIDSAEHPVLLESNHEKFHQLKELLLHERQILWVSFQSSSESAELAALKNMINGLARVIRRENPDLRLITVDVQDQCQGSPNKGLDHIIETITEVAASSFWSQNAARVVEFEYAILDGKLVIPRVIPDDKFARYINSRNPEQEKDVDSLVECKYLNSDRALVFDVQVPGLLNTIRFIDNEEMSEPLASGEIQVQARAHGLNFKDVFIALGQMAAGTIMAGEMAGVITAIGPDVQSWKVGDRVTGFMAAPFGNQVRINSNKVVAIPDSVSFTEAASITIVFYTAWYCLIYVARLEKGQTVLIHAASGGVGQAAIQLAKHVGAEIFATVSSADKSKLIQEQYGIPKTHIFSSHSGHFKKQIMDATKGRGVDVVLNSLSGQMLMDSWDCVAQFGTFLEIGKADIYGRSQLNMANFEKQATFAAVDVSHINRLRPEYVTRGLNEIYTMVDQGLIKPVYPVTTYSMDQIEDAFRLMAARKHVGKLVLVANDDTLVKATKQKCPPLRLHKEGTYVISGGVGDLGKRMGRFLAEKGAGHIVALTRRHLEPHQRVPLEQAISDLGSTLHIVQCDITDGSMTQAVAKALSGLPPVRGVIQSALVLCDHPLEYMELEDWKTAVEPKVQGTMNLHQAFCSPESTDFFIMLSSVASILGSNSQSNYAAGNAFQDAFAHAQNEHSRGITHYTTINIGGVEGSEQVARALDQNSQIVQIIGSVSFDEVLATLEYAMGPQSRADEAAQCLMYFNRDSMEDGLGPSALGEPLYGHVPSNRRHGERAAQGSASDDSKQSHARAAEQADSIAEAEDIVKDALVGKFAAFIGDDVPDNQPIAVLGLDSLVSIELKNWVKHTFQTPLQTSELSGARSITALAQLIVSRMDLKCKPKEADRDGEEDTQGLTRREKGPQHEQNGVVDGNGSNGQTASRWTCCKVHEVVSAQPLPDLDDSFDYWLEGNEHLFSSQELKSIHQDIQNMRAPNSTARHVLRSLLETHKNDDTNGWFTDAITDARFLQNRGPIAPYASIMGGHRDIEQVHTQSERAAIITSAVMSFKRAMDAGLVEPLDIGGMPECTWGWAWLFHSTRVPQLKCDKMVRYMPESASDRNHIAVLRKGRLFKVMLQNEEGEDVSLRQLRNVFKAITAQVQGDMEWTGILTTDNRDSWAKTRETLTNLSPENAAYFHVIDSSMFTLCLDTGSPESPEEIARHGYIGDGSNRWFDKVLQFYVSANGRSGQITEHGIIDGTTPARLLEWISTGMRNYPTQNAAHTQQITNGTSPSVELEEFSLQITPDIERHITILKKKFKQYTYASTYVREQLTELSKDFLIRSGAPVKGAIDVTFQLALRLFFGQNMLSWEPTSGARFHTGRADAMQRASPAVNAFCNSVAEAYQCQELSGKTAQLRQLLVAACKEWNSGMRTVLSGRTYLKTFEVLSHMWPMDQTPKPNFLKDHVFFGRPHPPIFAQTNALDSDIIFDDFVQLMPDGNGLWAILVPEKDRIRVSLTGGSAERTANFMKTLHQAAEIVRNIVSV